MTATGYMTNPDMGCSMRDEWYVLTIRTHSPKDIIWGNWGGDIYSSTPPILRTEGLRLGRKKKHNSTNFQESKGVTLTNDHLRHF